MRIVTLPAARLSELVATLAAEGYRPGIPAGLPLLARAADQELCRRMRCPACRHRGMAYRPFVSAGGRYRVVAGCPACQCAEEV
ncbi:MAG TPA: hypothetical protein VFW33_08665 [Gemmataceae bacterium]|nr:hypothetical protein [Gemmataceae bacterium]